MISIPIDVSTVFNVRGLLESIAQLPKNPQIGDVYYVRNDLDSNDLDSDSESDMYDAFVCTELNPLSWCNILKVDLASKP